MRRDVSAMARRRRALRALRRVHVAVATDLAQVTRPRSSGRHAVPPRRVA